MELTAAPLKARPAPEPAPAPTGAPQHADIAADILRSRATQVRVVIDGTDQAPDVDAMFSDPDAEGLVVSKYRLIEIVPQDRAGHIMRMLLVAEGAPMSVLAAERLRELVATVNATD